MKGSCFTLLFLLILSGCSSPDQSIEAPVSAAEQEVIEVANNFFDALGARDTSELSSIMLPDGIVYAVSVRGNEIRHSTATSAQMIERLGGGAEVLLERMWDPVVKVHGPIAVVWTPYDFHINGEFSHCGVDVFNFLKTDGAWKLAGAMYTVEPDGCAPSPLGSP